MSIIRRFMRNLGPGRCSLITFSAVMLLGLGLKAQNGIFADFTTSKGTFTCKLDYTNAPKAVANFIGLATAQRGWLDASTGIVRTNHFFDGLKFHRVIAGFMIQGGSPTGTGTGDPGYVFPDEIVSTIKFDRFGTLAMANSGPKSNGSQFFVTVEPTSWLNNLYTIFGRLTSGSNVVYAINHVATDTNDAPLTDVIIQSVAIRRVGTAAQNFSIDSHNLPVARNVALTALNSGAQLELDFTNRQFCDNRLFSSTNLLDWTSEPLGIEISGPGTNRVFRTPAGAKGFYRFGQVQYASSTFAPQNLNRKTLTLTFNGGGVLTASFNSSGGGTYTFPPNPSGTVTSYNYNQAPYRGFIPSIYFSSYYPMAMRLDFKSNTNGTFSASVYTPAEVPVTGTFKCSP
jgi:cyclophilin family peptidyl-prolyl cis-trans isomerase